MWCQNQWDSDLYLGTHVDDLICFHFKCLVICLMTTYYSSSGAVRHWKVKLVGYLLMYHAVKPQGL